MSGNTGLGWSGVVVVAILTSAGTFIVGWVLDSVRRAQARRELAATILADIQATLDLAAELNLEGLFKDLYDSFGVAIERGLDPANVSSAAPSFPPTVYEHCADRVGSLGVDVASEVVRFYNRLFGFRSALVIATAESALSFEGRRASIGMILKQFPAEGDRERRLKRKLERIAYP